MTKTLSSFIIKSFIVQNIWQKGGRTCALSSTRPLICNNELPFKADCFCLDTSTSSSFLCTVHGWLSQHVSLRGVFWKAAHDDRRRSNTTLCSFVCLMSVWQKRQILWLRLVSGSSFYWVFRSCQADGLSHRHTHGAHTLDWKRVRAWPSDRVTLGERNLFSSDLTRLCHLVSPGTPSRGPATQRNSFTLKSLLARWWRCVRWTGRRLAGTTSQSWPWRWVSVLPISVTTSFNTIKRD